LANIKPVTLAYFADKCWKPLTDYRFTVGDSFSPLVVHELPRAVMSLPVAFMLDKDRYVLVAVQGFEPQKNMLVNADGKWLTAYVPAAYRCYPFILASSEKNRKILCFDEDSGCLTDTGGGEPFFDNEKPSTTITEINKFLGMLDASKKKTDEICKSLQAHDLIQPWPLTANINDQGYNVRGLYRIDETALNTLPKDSLAELASSGAIKVSYCQLLSTQHMGSLQKLATLSGSKSGSKNPATGKTFADDLGFNLLDQDAKLNFDNL